MQQKRLEITIVTLGNDSLTPSRFNFALTVKASSKRGKGDFTVTKAGGHLGFKSIKTTTFARAAVNRA